MHGCRSAHPFGTQLCYSYVFTFLLACIIRTDSLDRIRGGACDKAYSDGTTSIQTTTIAPGTLSPSYKRRQKQYTACKEGSGGDILGGRPMILALSTRTHAMDRWAPGSRQQKKSSEANIGWDTCCVFNEKLFRSHKGGSTGLLISTKTCCIKEAGDLFPMTPFKLDLKKMNYYS